MMNDPYMLKTEVLLRQAKAKMESLGASMRASAPEFSALARRRKLRNAEARFAELNRRFDQLRSAGTEGIADLKVGLEKSLDAFRAEIGWKS